MATQLTEFDGTLTAWTSSIPSGATTEFLEDTITYASILLGAYQMEEYLPESRNTELIKARVWRGRMESRYSSVYMMWLVQTLGYGYEPEGQEDDNGTTT